MGASFRLQSQVMTDQLQPTAAEQKLIEAAASGMVADYRVGEREADDPAGGAEWGEERTLRAEIIYALCLGARPDWPVHPKGVEARGARIVGPVDFLSATLVSPLALVACFIEEELILADAEAPLLTLEGSHIRALNADGLKTRRGVFFRNGFTARGEVRLLGAVIGGNLECDGGTFDNPNGKALSADGLTTRGNVFLREGFTAKGEVRLLGGDIGGSVDCSGGTFENPDGHALSADRLKTGGGVFLREGFTAKGEVRLLGADIGGNLDCVGGSFENPRGNALSADRLKTGGSVFLRDRFTAKGEVRLLGADIGGDLSCVGGAFENPDGDALSADGLKTGGGVFLRQGFTAKGKVRLLGADIGGNLECDGGTFDNPNGYALNADGLKTGRDVLLRHGFTAKGEVRLPGADIGGNVECDRGAFENPDGYALVADELKTKGSVFLRNGFRAKGEVRLPGAHIGGDLDCVGGSFENPKSREKANNRDKPDRPALNAAGLKTRGNVFLREGFAAKGEVRFVGAEIGGQLSCTGGIFANPAGYALSADGLKTRGDVFLRDGFAAKGEVRLPGADIGGDFSCVGAAFENPDGKALGADGLKTSGDVLLSGDFRAKGEVRFPGADIGGDLSCIGGTFEKPNGEALIVANARIADRLFLRDLATPPRGRLDLGHAKVGVLVDDEESWPAAGKLVLDGFTYGAFGGDAPTGAAARLEWLGRQPKDHLRLQPYEQLVKVLRAMGHERDAREIAIAKQEALRESGQLGRLSNAWSAFYGETLGYGYKPWRLFRYFAAFLLLGTLVFDVAFHVDLMVPVKGLASQSANDPTSASTVGFHPLLYSLDVFVPIIDLNQTKYWLPNTGKLGGVIVLLYQFFQSLFGWYAGIMVTALATGLLKRD